MARPSHKELTDRELEVMHAYWKLGEATSSDARETLANAGLDLAYVTVANLTRILVEKGYLGADGPRIRRRFAAARLSRFARAAAGERL